MSITYFVALPFVVSDDGDLVAGEAQDRQTASAAVRAAEQMSRASAGAVAFSRTGDPATGEFEDAVVIREFGEVPSMDDLLSAGRDMSSTAGRFSCPDLDRRGAVINGDRQIVCLSASN